MTTEATKVGALRYPRLHYLRYGPNPLVENNWRTWDGPGGVTRCGTIAELGIFCSGGGSHFPCHPFSPRVPSDPLNGCSGGQSPE